eukprot:TRINITY_DN7543_c0_g1_i2.p1 TRINITY_DN7543_c0_g1~~TRINITY_DN7543_c0_g1_i2.p1  ORF type:complete len:111 (-),score=2.14 TRINITY_DN7543_c0_g1_i2:172-504(-)
MTELIPSVITSVDTVELQGFSAPLSTSGVLFVEDVLVSSYALLSDAQHTLWKGGPAFLREYTQEICHIAAFPFRLASSLGCGSAYLNALSTVFDWVSSSVLFFSWGSALS